MDGKNDSLPQGSLAHRRRGAPARDGLEISRLWFEGKTSKEIAQELGVTVRTVTYVVERDKLQEDPRSDGRLDRRRRAACPPGPLPLLDGIGAKEPKGLLGRLFGGLLPARKTPTLVVPTPPPAPKPPPPPRPAPTDGLRWRQLLPMRSKKMKVEEMAEVLGCSKGRIRDLMEEAKEAGHPIVGASLRGPEADEEIFKLCSEGLTYEQIARQVGLTVRTVQLAVSRLIAAERLQPPKRGRPKKNTSDPPQLSLPMPRP